MTPDPWSMFMLMTEHPVWGSGLSLLSVSGWGGWWGIALSITHGFSGPSNTYHTPGPLLDKSQLTR